jgi:hypothetical protein
MIDINSYDSNPRNNSFAQDFYSNQEKQLILTSE